MHVIPASHKVVGQLGMVWTGLLLLDRPVGKVSMKVFVDSQGIEDVADAPLLDIVVKLG